MIYPNAAKDRETIAYPYVELFRDFAASICRPNSTVVCYGYSFGDEHINRVIEDMLTIPSAHLVIIAHGDPLGPHHAHLRAAWQARPDHAVDRRPPRRLAVPCRSLPAEAGDRPHYLPHGGTAQGPLGHGAAAESTMPKHASVEGAIVVMSQAPFEQAGSLRIGAVEFVSPDEIKVGLDIEAPESVALNAGGPRPFPRVNGYLLVPVDETFLVGQVEWLTVERSPFPKRRGMQDFGLGGSAVSAPQIEAQPTRHAPQARAGWRIRASREAPMPCRRLAPLSSCRPNTAPLDRRVGRAALGENRHEPARRRRRGVHRSQPPVRASPRRAGKHRQRQVLLRCRPDPLEPRTGHAGARGWATQRSVHRTRPERRVRSRLQQ